MTHSIRQFLLDCMPARQQVDGRQQLRAAMGGFAGIVLTALVCRYWQGDVQGAWIVAPIGASAVLVFAVPNSPLAQPWSVIGGNTLCAAIGALCGMALPDPAWAGAAAVALAIGAMFSLRCLHPPGGAAALLCALSGVPLHFALFPVAANCVLLVCVAVAYNRLTGRRYPHGQGSPAATPSAPAGSRFSAADLDAALARYNQVLDISRDDLEELLHHAESAAYERTFGDLRCADVMTKQPLSVEYGTPLAQAWETMQQHHIKALPVVDRVQRVIGIVTLSDFLRAARIDEPQDITARLRTLVRPSGLSHTEKPEVVGQIMSTDLTCAVRTQRLGELIPMYARHSHHHLPVVDEAHRLVGILTESDMVRALCHNVTRLRP